MFHSISAHPATLQAAGDRHSDQAVATTVAPKSGRLPRRTFLAASAFLAAAVVTGGIPTGVAAADPQDGGGEYSQGTVGRVNSHIVVKDSLAATTIRIHSPNLDPAINGPQWVRWAPVLQVYVGSGQWRDFITSSWSVWKLTEPGVFGPKFPVWPDATAQIIGSGMARGTYYIRAGYYAQWYDNGAYSTKRWINREALLYQGHAGAFDQFMTYTVR